MGKPIATQRHASDPALTHDEAHASLYAYAHEGLMGGAPGDVYPEIAAHLAVCPHCRADLAELYAVVQHVADPAGAPVVTASRPNLSRLAPAWQPEPENLRPWVIDQFGRICLQFTAELLQSWRPAPLFGMARGDLLYSYTDPEASADEPSIEIEITSEDDPTTVQVNIIVMSPARPVLNQAGMGVALCFASTTRTEITDTSGCAEFSAVPRQVLDQLRFEITVDQST